LALQEKVAIERAGGKAKVAEACCRCFRQRVRSWLWTVLALILFLAFLFPAIANDASNASNMASLYSRSEDRSSVAMGTPAPLGYRIPDETNRNDAVGTSGPNAASTHGRRLTEVITDSNIQSVADGWLDNNDPASAHGHISNWDTSSVTDMDRVFYNIYIINSFNQDIGEWDTSSVTNMDRMFYNAENFDQNIGRWDVSRVTSMRLMLFGVEPFNQNIGSWDVSRVTNMEYMFSSTFPAMAFDQDIGNWDVSSVTTMESIFYRAPAFDQDIGSWNVSSVTTMESGKCHRYRIGYPSFHDILP
jgi:surface protein